MSHRTDRYVLEILEHDPTLPDGARKVLMAASLRANVRTSTTYTGEWLQKVSGLDRGNVWRALSVLARRGYLQVTHRSGRASVLTFPVQGFVAETGWPGTGRTDESGQFHPAICGCEWCREQTG